MKKKNILEKLSSGKGFYVTAAVSFLLIIAAIGFVYSSSVKLIEELPVPTTSAEEITPQVRKNKDDVADPRATTVAPSATQRQPGTTTEAPTEETTAADEVFSNNFFVYPAGENVCKKFSTAPVYDETMEDWRTHKGVDFSAEKGSDVTAIGDGRVVKVVADPSWGYFIEIDHGAFIARYYSLEQGTCLGIDAIVSRGDVIGKLSDIPCESAQESHLHFEIIKDGEYIDPLTQLGENTKR